MGFVSAVQQLIARLSSKRKSNRNDEKAGPPAKRVRMYELTPSERFTPTNVKNQRSKDFHYVYGEVILTTESRNYEFKSGGAFYTQSALQDLIRKYGSAFLNSEGGVLLAGVLDDGVVRGLNMNHNQQKRITKAIDSEFDKFRPKVSHSLYSIKYVPVVRKTSTRDLFVIEIQVRKGKTDEIYESGDHKVFIRRDGGVQGPLRPIAIKELAISKCKQAARDQESLKRQQEECVKDLSKDSDYSTL